MRQFALLSLTLHLAFLAVWRSPDAISFAGPGDNVLSVALSETAQAPSASQASAVSAVQPEETFTLPSKHTRSVNQLHRAKTNTATPAEGPAVSGSDTAVSPEMALAHIQAGLVGDLARHFHYPVLARRHGWEGTVLLGLRVASDGHLDKIRVERSSGYAVLDHSALNSLNRVGHLAEASAWLNGRSVDMQLPVIYRLIDN